MKLLATSSTLLLTILFLMNLSLARVASAATRFDLQLLWEQHDLGVRAVAFSPDGRLLAAGGNLYDVGTGAFVRAIQTSNKAGTPNAVDFSSNGRWLAIASDRTAGPENLNVYNLSDGSVAAKFNAFSNPTLCTHFTPDSKFLIASHNGGSARENPGSPSRALRIWKTEDWSLYREIGRSGRPVINCAVSPDNDTVALTSDDGYARLYRISTGVLVRAIRAGHDYIFAVAFSPEGSQIALGGNLSTGNKKIKIYDLHTGRLKSRFSWFDHGAVTDLQFSRDNKFLIAGGENDATPDAIGALRIYRVHDGSVALELPPVRGTFIHSVAFSPTMTLFAFSSAWHYGLKTEVGVGITPRF